MCILVYFNKEFDISVVRIYLILFFIYLSIRVLYIPLNERKGIKYTNESNTENENNNVFLSGCLSCFLHLQYIYSVSVLLWKCAWLGEALNFCLFAITNSATNLSFLIWLTVKGGVFAFFLSLSCRIIACSCCSICIPSSSCTTSYSLFPCVTVRPVSVSFVPSHVTV